MHSAAPHSSHSGPYNGCSAVKAQRCRASKKKLPLLHIGANGLGPGWRTLAPTLKHQTGQGKKTKNIPKWLKKKSFLLNSMHEVTWGQSMQLCSPQRSHLAPGIPRPGHVLTERLQMWEGPLLYFPLWFILPLHITLVWQQCIIRLHVIYKVIAAVQKYSEQENFRPTFSHRFVDMHAYSPSLLYLLKISQGDNKTKSKLFFLTGYSSIPCLCAVSINTEE